MNTYTTGYQSGASVAMGAEGVFVVVWSSDGSSGSDASGTSIQGRRYDGAGNPLGGELQINTYTTSDQTRPRVAMAADGAFVVVWQSDGSADGDTSAWSIHAQRYAAVGNALGSELQINTYATGDQTEPSVAMDAAGGFVVVWASGGSSGSDASGTSVQGARFDSAGTALGSEFQINSYTTSSQAYPDVGLRDDGGMIVAWQSAGSAGSDTASWSVQARRYDAEGNAVGSEFQVNTYTALEQRLPSIAAGEEGRSVVVWMSRGSSGSDTLTYSIQAQRYDGSGSAAGGELQVNTYTPGSQAFPSVSMEPGGGFVVLWQSPGSSGSDTGSSSIQGQRYDPAGSPAAGEFQVNSYTPSGQRLPSVSAGADGAFVAVWQSDGSSADDSSFESIQGQRYALPQAVPSLSAAGWLALAGLLIGAAVGPARRRAASQPG